MASLGLEGGGDEQESSLNFRLCCAHDVGRNSDINPFNGSVRQQFAGRELFSYRSYRGCSFYFTTCEQRGAKGLKGSLNA